LATPESAGIDPGRLDRLDALIESHIDQGRYPGAQYAVARRGKLVRVRTFGRAAIEPSSPAVDSTLWLLYSQTKVLVAAAVWQLVDNGALRFADRISDHIPDFARNGKQDVTLFEVLTHQGGFPNADVPDDTWEDHDHLRRAVYDFTLDWTPGSRVQYHSGSAHWVAAVLIETVTGRDFRAVIRDDLLGPIGLADDVYVGVPDDAQDRCADMHTFEDGTMAAPTKLNRPERRAAGIPGGGGYSTAAGMAAMYQMLVAGGALNGTRVLSPRVIQFATRSHTGDRVDEGMGMPMHRGLGPHVRGYTPTIRGLGTIAAPGTFGHGGAGSSYAWADPDSGASFCYVSNARAPEPWHSVRMDQVSNLAHSSIVEP
jgi:CubicO group peptidase (beta-lactamase class C family)